MGRKRQKRYAADFETTVYKGQTFTEVWAAALCEVGTENAFVTNSIDAFMTRCFDESRTNDIMLFFHNLKFDGTFIVDWLLRNGWKWVDVPEEAMPSYTFKTLVSDQNQWYSITIKRHIFAIEIRDSLKLLPFSLAQISKNFDTKHKKLEIEYEGNRAAGGTITKQERAYIRNDVLVLAEALQIMFERGHHLMTIGSCCMAEYKRLKGKHFFDEKFCNLFDLPSTIDGVSADAYIRRSYRGGWVYLKPDRAGKVIENGCTYDVNSLYPSVMHSSSGNRYPYGVPMFWRGNYIPDIAQDKDHYFFVRIRCRFYLKEGYLPFIQLKNNFRYQQNRCLTTSDVYDKKTGKYSPYIINLDGEREKAVAELTLTMTDFALFKEHYHVLDLVILDGCFFEADVGMFDTYLNKYRDLKINAPNIGERTISKLYSNNLYGKLASGDNSSYKVPYYDLKEERVKWRLVVGHDRRGGHIGMGAAVTSYARYYTITRAQKNYKYFVYSDTDSFHFACTPDKVTGIEIHPRNYNACKCEGEWAKGYFLRPKTYVEYAADWSTWLITACGLPSRSKKLLMLSISQQHKNPDALNEEDIKFLDSLSDREREFIDTPREITDFKVGLTIPGRLMPKVITGGTVLCDGEYTVKDV